MFKCYEYKTCIIFEKGFAYIVKYNYLIKNLNYQNMQWIIINFTNIGKIRFFFMFHFRKVKLMLIILEIWNVNAPEVKKETVKKTKDDKKYTVDDLYNRFLYFFVNRGADVGWAFENISIAQYYKLLESDREEFKNSFSLPYRLAHISILGYNNGNAAIEELNNLKSEICGGLIKTGEETWESAMAKAAKRKKEKRLKEEKEA